MFKKTAGVREAKNLRRLETVDIVRRLGAIGPGNIRLRDFPAGKPAAAFNPSIAVEGGVARVFARVVSGYCMYAYGSGYLGYVSAIAELKVPLRDIYSGSLAEEEYEAALALYPSTEYDAWGAEDPRVCEVGGKLWMVYVGRTVRYFEADAGRSVPIAAVRSERGWAKVCAFVLPGELRSEVVEDRDAFVAMTGDGKVHLFHRPQMRDGTYHLAVSSVAELRPSGEVKEVEVSGTTVVLEPADFELRIGWACPPVEVRRDAFLVLIHGVDRFLQRYRVFAALLEYDRGEGFAVAAVSPHYVMEAKEPYEVFGDRPHVVFPCGAWDIGGKLLISYGAADRTIGLAEVDIDELLSAVDAGRLA